MQPADSLPRRGRAPQVSLPCILAGLALALTVEGAEPVLARVQVGAGAWDRVDCPVEVVLNQGFRLPQSGVALAEEGTGTRLTGQCDAVGDGVRLRFILSGKTPAGAVRVFALVPGAAEAVMTASGDEPALELRHHGRPMLCYRKAPVLPPDGVDALHARNAYIHPVYTPSGAVVTGDFPPDHRHQRGVFLAWTKTAFQGRHPDFWNLGQGTGRVRSVALEQETSGPVWSGFVARHAHEDLKAPGGPVAVLDETWQVVAWAVGGPDAGWWLWDLAIEQRAVGEAALSLPKYHYGGMAFRGSDAWITAPWEFLSATGRTRQNADGTAAAWGDLSGELDGTWAGLTLIGHPGNVHFPQPFRCHPSVPYFCMAPSQAGPWSIEPGAALTLRYRVLVHDGRADAALADRLYQDLADPPQGVVLPGP